MMMTKTDVQTFMLKPFVIKVFRTSTILINQQW